MNPTPPRSAARRSSPTDPRAWPELGGLEAANLGLPVFPCRPGEKVPAVRGWQRSATTNASKILSFFEGKPEANVAVAARGLVIIDIDGRAGERSLERLDLDLPPTREVVTPRGRHLYFKGLVAGRCVPSLGAGLDVKGNRNGHAMGYVVAPGSVVNGVAYRWANDHPVAEAPEALLHLVQRPSLRSGLDVAPIHQGERNTKLTAMAGALVGVVGLRSEDEIRLVLQAINARRCRPPLSASEVSAIAQSAARNFNGQPWRGAPIEVASWVAAGDQSAKARMVLRCFADHADHQGKCWPALQRIQAVTGLGKNAVRNSIAELKQAERIWVNRRTGASSLYTLRCTTGTSYPPGRTTGSSTTGPAGQVTK